MSIARTALARGSGRVTVFYANRDEDSVIFARELREMASAHPDRLHVVHWLESVQGLPTLEQLRAFAADYLERDAFVCGPAPFMKMTTAALKELDFPRARRHQEKFVSLGGNPFGDVSPVVEVAEPPAPAATTAGVEESSAGDVRVTPDADPVRLEVELDGEKHVFDDWDRSTTLLEHLESRGVKAPYSCREGECSACAVRLIEGEVSRLTAEEAERRINDSGCPCTRYLTLVESIDRPHVEERGAAIRIVDGAETYRVANTPMLFTAADVGARPWVPTSGEHNEEILGARAER